MAIHRTESGQSIHYEVLGEGKPVLLIHGFTNYNLAWKPQLTKLMYSGYQVVLPDLRGHGLSSKVTEEVTVHDHCMDMISLMDALGIDRFTACGLSLGGMVALEMAVQSPERLHGIIVANSTAHFNGEQHQKAVDLWVQYFQKENGPLVRLEQTWDKLVNQAFRESACGKQVYNEWKLVLSGVDGDNFIHLARGMQSFDRRNQLKEIRMPALIIGSTEDRIFDVSVQQFIHSEIAGSELTIIDGASHISNTDAPEVFSDAMLHFLNKIYADGR